MPNHDIPSEIIYIKDKDTSNVWTLNSNVMPDEEEYNVGYGFGYVKEKHTSFGIIQDTEIFVPTVRQSTLNMDSSFFHTSKNAKVTIIKLKNTLSEKKNLKLIYYIKPVLGEDEIKTSGYINLKFNEEENVLLAKNIYGDGLSKQVFLSSSEKITSYTGNNLSFIRKWRFKPSRCNI